MSPTAKGRKRKRTAPRAKDGTGNRSGPTDTGSEAAGADHAEGLQSSFDISCDGKAIHCQRYGHSTKVPGLVFTHGASGTLASPATKLFMEGFSRSTPAVGFQGSMNLQSRTKYFHTVISHEKADTAALGGRSLGARAAVVAAKDHQTAALILASYPLIGQNGDVRDQILLDVDANLHVLFISGDNDKMCPIAQLSGIRAKMQAKSWLVVVQGADHGLGLKPKDAVEPMREYCGTAAARWLEHRDEHLTECLLQWDESTQQIVDDGWQASTASPSRPQEKVRSTSHKQKSSAKRRKKE